VATSTLQQLPGNPNNDEESIAEVRAVLQAFQDGYTHRDSGQLDAFMELFVADEALEVIGTGAQSPGNGEWCMGVDATRKLIESDWAYWGDLHLDVAGATIHLLGDVAWLATRATVTEHIEGAANYNAYVGYAREVLDQELTPEMKLLELVRTGAHALFESAQGDDYIWPLRFTALLIRVDGTWRFHQMQFSYPTTRFPDVRMETAP
jgi:hypothetical protein